MPVLSLFKRRGDSCVNHKQICGCLGSLRILALAYVALICSKRGGTVYNIIEMDFAQELIVLQQLSAAASGAGIDDGSDLLVCNLEPADVECICSMECTEADGPVFWQRATEAQISVSNISKYELQL